MQKERKNNMAKNKTVFVCNECGYESPKWMGKCPSCNAWNSFVEEKIKKETGFDIRNFKEATLLYIIYINSKK